MLQLSNDLLQDEERTKLDIESLFVAQLDAVVGRVENVSATRNVNPVARDLSQLAADAVTATRDPYRALANRALARALDSIGEELLICERTLSKKYEGLAEEAVESVRAFAVDLVDAAVDAYEASALSVVPWFGARVRSELKTSLAMEESAQLRVARMISGDSLRTMRDHSGRGLWWKVLEHCNRVTRESEFSTLNAIRLHVMRAFNDLAELR